ncbi:MAG: hypothetical protein HY721_27865 [Planctomycetes bacterium]|nr:hypothetical protein [Planctomycetota bacterium]
MVSALGLAGGGCDGGGGGGGSSEAGIELPSEISAVSVQGDSGGAYRAGRAARGSVARMLQARTARIQEAVEDLPADADYNTVQVRKFVEIEVLDIFEIIDTIFDAVRQTHYADVENVGSGWYKCMVAFEDEGEGGVTFTQLQEWYVNSTLVGGVNRVRLKILEPDRDGSGEMLILVQADISQAPTENEDGTLADLGVWEIRAVFGEPGAEPAEDEFFHATADITGDGLARLTIEDQFRESIDGDEFLASTRAVVFRSLDEGYGVAEYPNWEACWGPSPEDCSEGPPAVTVLFAYNTNYLSVEVDGDASSFDRTDEHEIVHRYKLYNTTDGSDVERTHTYGFPIRVNEDGDNRFGWYGAWQDRHQVWAHGDSVDDGTSVVRNDGPPGEEPPEYTVRAFSGALTRVQLVEGSLSQVEDIAAEVFLHNDVRLRWDADTDTWFECIGDDGFGGCTSLEDFTDKLPLLAMGGDGDQKQVWINHFEMGESGPSQTQYVYLTSAPGPGFFVAQPNSETGRLESTGVALDTGSLADNWDLFCWVSGRAYIQYTGDFDGPATSTGWVEKTVTDFDFESYTPTFDEDADREFVFELGRSYFISNRGANFRVARTGEAGDATDYDVFMEVHTVAKPTGDLGSVYPDGTVLVDGWNPEQSSTYTLDTDSESANYLLLEYASVSESDEGDGAQVGDVVTKDLWGLRVQGDASDFGEATFYNWTYQEEGDFWGGVSYLVDGAGEFVLVDEPLRFEPIQLASTDDIVNERPESEWLSYSLGFDGHLHGLPDTWWELQKVDFAADHLPAVLAKNVRIPDGTVLTDSSDGTTTYYVKAVDVGIFLGYVTAFPAGEEPDLTPAQAIDLDAELPEFDPPNISPTIPENAELLYIDGVPVE